MSKGYIYLASPYTHADEAVRAQRYNSVLEATARYISEGHFIYSPIVHSHPLETVCALPGDWKFWAAFDEAMIQGASELWVLMIDGWQQSVGVRAEIEIAKRLNINIRFQEPRRAVEAVRGKVRGEGE